MTRRSGLAGLLLGLAILLGQLGGAIHSLSHLGDAGKERPHAACQLCVAYSAFDHASPATHAGLTAESLEVAGIEQHRYGHTPRFTFPYATRAPPQHLA